MMYHIYTVSLDHRNRGVGTEYFFVAENADKTYWSSDFRDLEQLCDVGLDDPDLVEARSYKDVRYEIEQYGDCTYIFSTDVLDYDYLAQHFPEYLI